MMKHQKVFEKKAHSSWVGCLRFSKDGRYIASGGGDNAIVLLDANTGKEISVLHSHHMGIYSLDFNDDSNMIVSGGYDNSIKLWDIDNEKLIRSVIDLKGYWFFENKKWKFFTTNHKRFIHWEKMIRKNYSSIGLSHVDEFEIAPVINISHLSFVSHCHFFNSSKCILSTDGDGELIIWNANSFEVVNRLSLKLQSIRAVSYDSFGRNIIVAGDNFLKILDAKTLNVIIDPSCVKEGIRSVDLIDKNKLVTGDNACRVKVWDIHNLDANIEIGCHHHCVIYVKYMPDHGLILSAARDEVKMWRIDDYGDAGLFDKDFSNISSACLSDDGKRLAFGQYDGMITCYELFN